MLLLCHCFRCCAVVASSRATSWKVIVRGLKDAAADRRLWSEWSMRDARVLNRARSTNLHVASSRFDRFLIEDAGDLPRSAVNGATFSSDSCFNSLTIISRWSTVRRVYPRDYIPSRIDFNLILFVSIVRSDVDRVIYFQWIHSPLYIYHGDE